jgi:methionine salvage enolase-phosphatase E1
MVTMLALAVSIVGVIILPLVVLMFRAAIRWKGIEDKLDNVVSDLTELVKDKDKIHAELANAMREDRRSNDRRLRWLEENLWKHGYRS